MRDFRSKFQRSRAFFQPQMFIFFPFRVGHFLLLSAVFCCFSASGALNSIRIVDEPVSYGIGNDLIQVSVREFRSVSQFQPANFSGPQQLQRLKGLCFDFDSGKYRYALCPFDNVTQTSVNHWPSYRTILGIWQGWEIINNTFHAMLMSGGDLCGKEHRRVKVTLSCNNSDVVVHVAEPEKCRYEMHFWTRLVCHSESMLVYPRLPGFLRERWDELYTRFMSQEITEKGYEDGLSRIFVQAGLYSPKPSNPLLATVAGTVTLASFESLPQCQMEYDKLRRELGSLRLLLALNELPNEDTKT